MLIRSSCVHIRIIFGTENSSLEYLSPMVRGCQSTGTGMLLRKERKNRLTKTEIITRS